MKQSAYTQMRVKCVLNDFLNLNLCTHDFIGLNLYPAEVNSLLSAYYLKSRIRENGNCLASGNNSSRRQEQTPQFVIPLL